MNAIEPQAALKHFKTTDPLMHALLADALEGPDAITIPHPKPPSVYFATLVGSIVGQQISVKAASAVRSRVVTFLGGTITPEAVQASDFADLKACGLSNQKATYIKRNADVWPTLQVNSFRDMTDEEVIAELVQLHGIGRWTAEMFLMSSLARPDVFSYGDLGLMQSLYQSYHYKPHYVRKIKATVDNWSPHKTLASFALWHTKDNAPTVD